MTDLPLTLCTKQDYQNAVEFGKSNGEAKGVLIARLINLKLTIGMMQLKNESRAKRAETQHQEDYISVPDPNCELRRLGFCVEEIDALIGELENA